MRVLGRRVLIVVLATVGIGSSALAQSDAVVISGTELGVMSTSQIQARIAELEKAYDSVKLAGPRAGVGISAILVPGGALTIGVGAAMRSIETTLLCPPSDPRCGDPTAGSAAVVVVGVLALVGGVVGVAMSTRKLKRRKEERSRIQFEIDRLNVRCRPCDVSLPLVRVDHAAGACDTHVQLGIALVEDGAGAGELYVELLVGPDVHRAVA